MISQDLNDSQIIHDVLSGDVQQFEEIIKRYQSMVYKLVATALFSREETEAIVQQVFINCFKHLDQYEVDRSFSDWIKVITTKEVFLSLENLKERQEHLEVYREDLEHRLYSDKFYEELEGRQKEVEKSVNNLPHTIKKIIEWKYKDAYSIEKIAKMLEKTPSDVEQILFLYRQKLSDTVNP